MRAWMFRSHLMAEPYVFFRWPVQGREYRRAALGALASLHMSDIALRRVA